MDSAILHIRWLGKPAQRFVFSSVEDAVESAHVICARFSATPEGVDWQEKLVKGEFVRASTFTMQVEKTEFHSGALTTDEPLPEPEADHDPLVCYLLMRSDVPSFVNGKAMAQAQHNGFALLWRAITKNDQALMDDLKEYAEEADGFGTCITLEVTAAAMRQAVSLAQLIGLYADIINDPTYPIKDGDQIKTLPIDTCAFIFGRQSQARLAVKGFNLFP